MKTRHLIGIIGFAGFIIGMLADIDGLIMAGNFFMVVAVTLIIFRK